MSEEVLLEAARRGDEAAYAELVAPRRGELQAHCYRMLGSVQDAEDALQDALLRAWRGLPRFQGRSSVRSWLYRIATNTCLDALAAPAGADAAARPRAGVRPARRARAPAGGVGVDRAVSRTNGSAARLDEARAGGPLRHARERRAGVRRRAPAPAAAPAGGAHPARGAGVLGRRGRGGARHDRRVGQQRPPAGPRVARRPPARREPAGRGAVARRRRAAGDRRPLRRGLGGRRRGRGRGDAGGGRGGHDAADGHLVRGPRRGARVPGASGRSRGAGRANARSSRPASATSAWCARARTASPRWPRTTGIPRPARSGRTPSRCSRSGAAGSPRWTGS